MIAIVNYDTGNIRSVTNALARVGCTEWIYTDDKALLAQADKVILPGVGEASTAMAKLAERGLTSFIPTLTQPVLGICVGTQLMCQSSEEGNVECMGIFRTQVKRFLKFLLRRFHTWAGTKSLTCAHRSSRVSTREHTFTTYTLTTRCYAPTPSPQATTSMVSAGRWDVTTSSAHNSIPRRAEPSERRSSRTSLSYKRSALRTRGGSALEIDIEQLTRCHKRGEFTIKYLTLLACKQ